MDHKEAGKTCLVVQTVEALRADSSRRSSRRAQAGRGARQRQRRARAAACTCASIAASLSRERDRGPQAGDRGLPRSRPRCVLEIDTSAGARRLRLGEAYRVQNTPTLRAELEHVALAPPLPSLPRRSPRAWSLGPRSPERSPSAEADVPVRCWIPRCAPSPRSRSSIASSTSARVGALAVLAGGLQHARQPLQLRAPRGTRRSPARRARPRRCSRGGRGWSRAASASR